MCVYVCMYVCMYTRIQHPHHQHWSSSGLCSLPTAILALHKWLHCYWPLCQTPEVCRWHHNHRSHPGRRQVCLQTRGWAAGCLVQSQQPGAEHAQNCRGDSGLQEKPPCSLPPLTIMNSTVTAVESFRFLGTTISQDLKWDNHIDSIVKKAPQRLFFLRQLKKFNLPPAHMTQFYSAVIESVLCSSITVWFGSASKSDIRGLQRTVRTAERIICVHLLSLQDLYYSRVKKRTGNIITDPSHPGHNLFVLLPSGRHYRSLCTRTSRHKNCFSPMHSPA